MTLFLNFLLLLIGISGLATRLMELEYLQNNLELKLVSDPILLAIIYLILICASTLVCSNKSFDKFKVPTFPKILSLITGFAFLTYYFMNFGSTSQLDMFMLLAGVGFVFYSFSRDKNSIANLFYMIPLSAFAIGLSLQTILFDVSSTNNTIYLFESLCSSSILLFLLAIFRSINYPTPSSFSSIYIFGMATFLLTNATYLASAVYSILKDDYTISSLTLNIAFTLLGIFTASMAVNVSKQGTLVNPASEFEDLILDNSIEVDNSSTIVEENIESIDKERAVLSLFSDAKEDISATKEKTIEVSASASNDTIDTNENSTAQSISQLFTLKSDTDLSINSSEKEQDNMAYTQKEEYKPAISSLFTNDTNTSNFEEIQIKTPIITLEDKEEVTPKPSISISSLFSSDELEIIDKMKTSQANIEKDTTPEITSAVSISQLFSSDEEIKTTPEININTDKTFEPITKKVNDVIESSNESHTFTLKDDITQENTSENKISTLFTLKSDSFEPKTNVVEINDEVSDKEKVISFNNISKDKTETPAEVISEINTALQDISSNISNDETNTPTKLSEPSDNDVLMNFLSKQLEDSKSASNTKELPDIKTEKNTSPSSSNTLTKKGEKFIFKSDAPTTKKSSKNRILFKKD